jgi:hypothetical protein
MFCDLVARWHRRCSQFKSSNEVLDLCFVTWLLGGTEGAVNSYQVKQLEQQNDRMKEALVK